MDGTGYGQHVAGHGEMRKPAATKPGECGSTGAACCVRVDRQGALMLEKAQTLLQPSARSDVPPFMVMDVVAAAARLEAQGRRVIHMEVGQPAAGAPTPAIAAAQAALASAARSATPRLWALRRCGGASRRPMREWHGLEIDPARIVVTTGSSGGFILAFLAAFEAGDRVAMALPGYPPYRHILTALGCEPVGIETNAQTRWSITAESLLAQHRARPLKGVIVASPANPSGTMMTADALAEVIRSAEDAGIAVISDEIYHGLDYAFRRRDLRRAFRPMRSSSIPFPNISA